MFLKTNSLKTASELKKLGFDYTVEHVGGETFYCFLQTEELAKIILGQYADVSFLADNKLRF